MNKIPKVLILTFIILPVISILLAGCGDQASPSVSESIQSPPSSSGANSSSPSTAAVYLNERTAQEIALNSMSAISEIEFLKFDMDLSMSFALPTGEGSSTMTMHQMGTSSVNLADKQMYMNMNMEMDMPEQGKQNMSAEIYSTGGWLYMKSNVPGIGDQWTKMKLTDELWAKQCQLSTMVDFLNTSGNLELAGRERIGGVDCYILNIVPDLNSITNWMAGQMQSGSARLNPDVLNDSQMFQSFTVKEWIDVNNFFPVKQQIRIKYGSTSSVQGSTESGYNQMAMDMNASLNYYDFGKSVTIQLPAAALNAMELSPTE